MTETPIMAISILPFPVCKITISCDFMTFLAQYCSVYCVFVQRKFNKIETAQPFRLGGSNYFPLMILQICRVSKFSIAANSEGFAPA